MWQHTTSGKLIYQRVYPDHKFIIDYGANSPRVPGAHSLVVNAGIINADWLAMNACPEQKHDGYVITCRGEDGQQLLWFEELDLPYHASWQHANSKRSLTLKQLQHFDSHAFLTELRAYETMDYADIGDNEAHPTLQTILSPSALGAGSPGHGEAPAANHHNH